MLLKLQLEAPVSVFHTEAASWKGIFECGRECFISSDFQDGLEGSGEIAAVVMENRSESTDLSSSRRRFGIGPKVIIKAPPANGFADRQHFGSPLWVGHAGEHAIRIREVLRQHDGLFIACCRQPDEIFSPIHQSGFLAIDRAVPDALALHTWV